MTNRATLDVCIAARQRRAVSEYRSLYQFMMSMLASGKIGRGQTPVADVQLTAFRRLKQLPASATGGSFPIGATLINGGANFSIFSRTAASIELLLFDRVDDARPSRVIPIDPVSEPHAPLLEVFVPGVEAGQIYGFRAFGPFQPDWGSQV